MSEKQQNKSIIIAIVVFVLIVAAVGLIGYLTQSGKDESIQGEIEVSEYRVSSKVPGRILQILVEEGEYVHAGDTLAIIDSPEIEAKKTQAQSAEDAAAAISEMAQNGARQETIRGALELLKQAQAGVEIAKKSFERVQRLFDEGVVSAQKRDEAEAQYKVLKAQEQAAKSQYDMAVNGARAEEKKAAAAQVNRAKGAISEVNSYMRETVQIAQMDGEVSNIYPKVGELVGTGAPIMTISMTNDAWGTFNVREDQLQGIKTGDTFSVFVPAFNKEVEMKVFHVKDLGSYAVWKSTKANGQYDMKTFEVKARPVKKEEGLIPGMSLILKR